MRRFYFLIYILCLIFAQISTAHAWSLYFVGMGTSHGESRDGPAGTQSSAMAPGGGTLIAITMAPKLEFETGILYITQRRIHLSPSDILTVQNKNAFQFPVIIRFRPASWFHVGLGPYFALGLGCSQTVGTQTQSVSLASLGLKSSDLGLIGIIGTGYEFGDLLDKPVSIVLDIAYTLGFGSMVADTSLAQATSIKYNDFHLIAGFRMDI